MWTCRDYLNEKLSKCEKHTKKSEQTAPIIGELILDFFVVIT